MSRVLVLGALLISVTAMSASAQMSETRVALVIGNSNYANVSRLANPSGDAKAVAQAFKNLGFETIRAEHDLGFDGMRRVLRDFAAVAENAHWAVVYYAGHGIEVDGGNYLIPVDARLKTDRDVQFEAVPLDQVLASVEGASKLRLIILDACRDNPFIRQMKRSVASRSIGRGLARVEPPGGGTLVAYAAKAGQIAFDGMGENSPFVSSLVRRFSEPGVEINKVFRAVRDDVLIATEHKQEPFVYGSLPNEDFYFKPAVVPEHEPQLQPSSAGASSVVPADSLPAAAAPAGLPMRPVPTPPTVVPPVPDAPGRATRPGSVRQPKLTIKKKAPLEAGLPARERVQPKASSARRGEPRQRNAIVARPAQVRPASPAQPGGYRADGAAPPPWRSHGNDPKDPWGAWGNWYDR